MRTKTSRRLHRAARPALWLAASRSEQPKSTFCGVIQWPLLAAFFALIVGLFGPPATASSLDPRTFAPRYVHEVFDASDGLPKTRLIQVVQTPDHYLWVASSAGLVRFDGAQFRVFDTATWPALGSDSIAKLHPTQDGSLWILSEAGHVSRWIGSEIQSCVAPQEGEMSPCGSSPWTDSESLPTQPWLSGADSQGRIWTVQGPHLIRGEGTEIFSILEGPGQLTSLWIDPADDTLWMTSDSGTLHALFPARATTLVPPSGPESVQAVYEDVDGSLWFAGRTLNHLTFPASDDGEAITPVEYSNHAQDAVNAIQRDARGVLWLGTLNGLYGVENGRFARPQGMPRLEAARIYALLLGDDGTLWVGSEEGLFRRSSSNDIGGWEHLDLIPGAEPWVQVLLETEPGTLWIGTRGQGLGRWQEGKVHFLDSDSGLPGNSLRALWRSPAGYLWIGTEDHGLLRLDTRSLDPGSDLRLATINRSQGLPTNGVHHLLFDGDFLWMSSNDGIFRAAYDDLKAAARGITSLIPWTRFDERDGLFDRAANGGVQQAGLRHSSGHLYFPTPAGLARFDPELFPDPTPLPPPRLVLAPHVYESPYFLAGMAFLLLLALWGIVHWRLNLLRRRAQDLEAQVAERTATVAAQAQKLERLNRAKSHLFTDISHELRTPLMLITGSLRDYQREVAQVDPKPIAEVELALENAERMLGLVEQVLDIATLESGEIGLQLKAGDAVELVRRAFERASGLAQRQQIDLVAEWRLESLPASFDASQLDKLLDNLLGNALKYSSPGDRVRLDVRLAEEEHFEILVADNGPGIPAQDLEKIFDRYYRVPSRHGAEAAGTGLGLALARQITLLHGGTLIAESTEGEGACFTLRLPRNPADPTEIAQGRAAVRDLATGMESWDQDASQRFSGAFHPAPLQRSRQDPAKTAGGEEDSRAEILLVEDHPDLRSYLERHLRDTYRVRTAADGLEALEMAQEEAPDLVVCDIMMPRLNGRDFFRHLRQDPELDLIPVILMTAISSSDSRLEGLREGVDDYLVKPFDPEELHARIQSILSSRRRLLDRIAPPTPTALKLLPEIEVTSADQTFLDKVVQVIEHHLDDSDLTVEKLASKVGCDRSHLFRRLRTLTNETPSSLIRSLRLQRAEQLLRANAGRVNEIAYSVGFKSLSHFSNTFAREFGERPSAFAARHRQPQALPGPLPS